MPSSLKLSKGRNRKKKSTDRPPDDDIFAAEAVAISNAMSRQNSHPLPRNDAAGTSAEDGHSSSSIDTVLPSSSTQPPRVRFYPSIPVIKETAGKHTVDNQSNLIALVFIMTRKK